MAKSTKKVTDTKKVETKAATVKEASKTTATKVEKAVDEQKKLTTAKEPAKITTAKEAKKITTAKEPKKISAKKEPEKIAAKPQPEKIETKKVEQLPLKEEAPAVTAEVKKETKKAAPKKTVKKAAEKAEDTKNAKEKKAPAKSKTAAKPKEAGKKTSAKKASKTADADVYQTWTVEECITAMQSMGVQYDYEDYKRILLDEADVTVLEKNILEGNGLLDQVLSFEKDGYDQGLILITLNKVMDTMDLKAADFSALKRDMTASVKTVLDEDAEKNASEYLKEFKLCEKLLMIGQRKGINEAKSISDLIGADVDAFVAHFFDLAYAILPTWQYNDVKFYEDFAYAVLSQYHDLYDAYQMRILMDVADLYIKHGDFNHGDVCYGYVLRDNQIKDYIYYRFAHVYEDIDINKAKSLAYESMQYVDGRYSYYQNIMDIIQK